jgi:hypothetical protein
VEFEALSDVHQLLHAVLAWLAGPSADMSDSATKAHFKDYLNRIHYWVGSGFEADGSYNC